MPQNSGLFDGDDVVEGNCAIVVQSVLRADGNLRGQAANPTVIGATLTQFKYGIAHPRVRISAGRVRCPAGQGRSAASLEMNLADSTLLLLYSSTKLLRVAELAVHLERDSLSNYRRVLKRLHDNRIIELAESVGVWFSYLR